MTTDGGRRVRAAQPFGQDLDAIAEGLGLGLFQLSVTGHRRTPDSDIFDAAQGGQSHSLLFFDTAAARARIEALPWVAVARVRRVFPDELRVSVTEREPYARWRQDTHEVLLDATGRLLGPAPPGTYSELPVVAGPDAASEAIKLLNELKRWPALERRIDYAERVSTRRWRLVLRDGRRIELPENEWLRAMSLVVEPQAGVRLIDRGFATLDLRIPGQPMVRPLEPRGPVGRQ
jgi:cell division protein FtsQ